jgi:SAM-dependent methyltransferase
MNPALSEMLSCSRKLNVGCGILKISGFIGIDILPDSAAEVLHDLNKYPWPFSDNSFSHVICSHSLGHLDDLPAAICELHRITEPGGIVEILSPHFASDNAFTDVTHRRAFGYRSMDYFCQNRECPFRYAGPPKFVLREVRISFLQAKVFDGERVKPNPFKWIGLEWLINHAPRFYEHFLAFILRPNEVYFLLEVVKY